jgi:hypothetical protein
MSDGKQMQADLLAQLEQQLAAANARVRQLESTLAACREAGFVTDGGRPIHIPKHCTPTRHDVDYLAEFVEWHGAVHLHGCPEDDTCVCGGRPVNEATNKCLLFLKHFAGGQTREATEAAGGRAINMTTPMPPDQKLFNTSVVHPNGTAYCIDFLAPSIGVAAILNEAMRGDPVKWGETVWIGDVVKDGLITEWSGSDEEVRH